MFMLPGSKPAVPPPRPLTEEEKSVLYCYQKDIYLIRLERQNKVAAELAEAVPKAEKKGLPHSSSSVRPKRGNAGHHDNRNNSIVVAEEGVLVQPSSPPTMNNPAGGGGVLPPIVKKMIKQDIEKYEMIQHFECKVKGGHNDNNEEPSSRDLKRSFRRKPRPSIGIGDNALNSSSSQSPLGNEAPPESPPSTGKRHHHHHHSVWARRVGLTVEQKVYKHEISAVEEQEEQRVKKLSVVESCNDWSTGGTGSNLEHHHGRNFQVFHRRDAVRCITPEELLENSNSIVQKKTQLFQSGCKVKKPLPFTLEVLQMTEGTLLRDGIGLLDKFLKQNTQSTADNNSTGTNAAPRPRENPMLKDVLAGKVSLKSVHPELLDKLAFSVTNLTLDQLLKFRGMFPPNVATSCREDLKRLVEKVDSSIAELLVEMLVLRLERIRNSRPTYAQALKILNKKKKQEKREIAKMFANKNAFLQDEYLPRDKKMSSNGDIVMEGDIIIVPQHSQQTLFQKITSAMKGSKERTNVSFREVPEGGGPPSPLNSNVEIASPAIRKSSGIAGFLTKKKDSGITPRESKTLIHYHSDTPETSVLDLAFPDFEDLGYDDKLPQNERRAVGRRVLTILGLLGHSKLPQISVSDSNSNLKLREFAAIQTWWFVPFEGRPSVGAVGFFFEFPSMCGSCKRPKERNVLTIRGSESSYNPFAGGVTGGSRWEVRSLPYGGDLQAFLPDDNRGAMNELRNALRIKNAGSGDTKPYISQQPKPPPKPFAKPDPKQEEGLTFAQLLAKRALERAARNNPTPPPPPALAPAPPPPLAPAPPPQLAPTPPALPPAPPELASTSPTSAPPTPPAVPPKKSVSMRPELQELVNLPSWIKSSSSDRKSSSRRRETPTSAKMFDFKHNQMSLKSTNEGGSSPASSLSASPLSSRRTMTPGSTLSRRRHYSSDGQALNTAGTSNSNLVIRKCEMTPEVTLMQHLAAIRQGAVLKRKKDCDS